MSPRMSKKPATGEPGLAREKVNASFGFEAPFDEEFIAGKNFRTGFSREARVDSHDSVDLVRRSGGVVPIARTVRPPGVALQLLEQSQETPLHRNVIDPYLEQQPSCPCGGGNRLRRRDLMADGVVILQTSPVSDEAPFWGLSIVSLCASRKKVSQKALSQQDRPGKRLASYHDTTCDWQEASYL